MFRDYRLKAKLTQEELAEKVGISWRQIQRIESGKNPSVVTFGKLIQALKITNKDVIEYLKEKSHEERNERTS